MMRAALVAALAIAGCHHPTPVEPIATPAPGIAMAFYQGGGKSYTVVDDRRTIEIRGGVLVLDHIDPGAALPSLVIEPLGGASIAIGQCDRDRETQAVSPADALARYAEWQTRRRERLDAGDVDGQADPAPDNTMTIVSPVVRCTVTGGDGSHLVRVLYVSSSLAYKAQHVVTMTAADRATIATRFTIAAPAWGGRADVVLYEGLPGGDKPAVELARGSLALDGSTALLGAPPREVTAHVRRVFDGAIRTGV